MNDKDTLIAAHAGSVPTAPIVWPATSPHQVNKVQQVKGSAKPQTANVLPTTQPNASAVPPRTTPAPVSQVRVVTQPAVNGNKTVIVQFNHPPNDPYFASANVYLRKAGDTQPTLVGGGAQSPIKLLVPVHSAPHALHISSVGNWGETDIMTSPSRPISLR